MASDKDYNQPLQGFPNILLHKGVYTSTDGQNTMTIEGYYTDTMLLLSQLRWKFTGWAVFTEIWRRTKQKMRIVPYNEAINSLRATDTQQQAINKLKQNHNATAGPTHWDRSAPKGQTVLSCGGPSQNKPLQNRFLFFNYDMKSDGSGSDTVVSFTPAMWETGDATAAFGAANAAGPGVKKDEILLHEIVHGMRQMSGTARCAAVPDSPGMHTVEEFMAIVISNVYRSELNLSGLRNDHRGFALLPADQSDSQKFLDKDKDKPTSNYKRMLQLKREHPQLCDDLKKVNATFNPFKLI